MEDPPPPTSRPAPLLLLLLLFVFLPTLLLPHLLLKCIWLNIRPSGNLDETILYQIWLALI